MTKLLQIKDDPKNGLYVENLTEEYVTSYEDVTQILIKVEKQISQDHSTLPMLYPVTTFLFCSVTFYPCVIYRGFQVERLEQQASILRVHDPILCLLSF